MLAQAYTLAPNSSIVGVQILPPPFAESSRPPFHLALFLDTSTSMSGERLESVKHTLHAVIDHMTATDALTLIEYNSDATVLCKQCSNKEQLLEITNGLKATKSTNLEKALYAFPTDCIPDAICILTDGENTEGLSGTEELLFLTKRLLPKGVGVCCLGYGADHNEKLLQTLALRSRGSYTYMSNAEMVPVGVGTIVSALETEIARNAYIELDSQRQCLELLAAEDGKFVIGSLFAEKAQWLIMDIQNLETPIPFHWTDRLTGEVQSLEIPIQSSEQRNEDVYEQHLRIQCLKRMDSAKRCLESYTVTETEIQAVTELLTEMEHSTISARPLLIRLQAQLSELLVTLKNMVSVNGLPPRPPFASWIGRQPNNVYLTRLTSDMTTFTVQRGVLSAAPNDHDPTNNDLYASPVQRRITGQITQGYHTQTQG